ncbi:MAG: hypothetical protein GTN80_10335, partial [Nitrososphaeria archaeon]|nr:hypothetical protein [Nitrososphaeria archaeon]
MSVLKNLINNFKKIENARLKMSGEFKTRIVGGGISHESCTFITRFIPGRVTWEGEEAIEYNRGKRTNLS